MSGIRPMFEKDRHPIIKALRDTAMFTEAEIDVAIELIDKYLYDKDQKDYTIFVAEEDGQAAGYVCYGPTPATEGTYDLYWIAVTPASQGKGTGKKLLEFTENEIRKAGGRLLIIETSSQEKYAPTQNFYIRNKYEIEARIKDFYRKNDDRLIFTKRL